MLLLLDSEIATLVVIELVLLRVFAQLVCIEPFVGPA